MLTFGGISCTYDSSRNEKHCKKKKKNVYISEQMCKLVPTLAGNLCGNGCNGWNAESWSWGKCLHFKCKYTCGSFCPITVPTLWRQPASTGRYISIWTMTHIFVIALVHRHNGFQIRQSKSVDFQLYFKCLTRVFN